MPVRNGGRYIQASIESLLSQSFEDFNIIISDNASNDDTQEICREFADRDKRIRYERTNCNEGAAWNYNRVFGLSDAKYFKWATHDDVCEPDFLLKCIKVLEKGPPDLALVYPKSAFIDEDDKLIKVDTDDFDIRGKNPVYRLIKAIRKVNMVNAIFGVFRSSVLKKSRLIDSFVASDYILLGEIALQGQIWQVPELLYNRRQHKESCMEANKTKKEILEWFNPKIKKKIGILQSYFPTSYMHARLVLEWSKSVHRSPISIGSKLSLYPSIPLVWYGRKFYNWGGRQKQKIKKLVSN